MNTIMYTQSVAMLTGSNLVRMSICELLALRFPELMYSSLLVVRETFTDMEPGQQFVLKTEKWIIHSPGFKGRVPVVNLQS